MRIASTVITVELAQDVANRGQVLGHVIDGLVKTRGADQAVDLIVLAVDAGAGNTYADRINRALNVQVDAR